MYQTFNKLIMAVTLLGLLLLVPSSIAHTCVHDKMKFEPKFIDMNYDTSDGRTLQAATYEPIRIVFDFSTLTGVTDTFRNYVQNTILPPAQNYLQAALKVRRAAGNLTAMGQTLICDNVVNVPSIYNSGGVVADLVIFVTQTNEASQSFVAYAGACLMDGTTRRPVFGRLNYNLAKVSASTLEARIERDIGVTLHEITHVLGFSDGLFLNFVNPITYAVLTGHRFTRTVNGQTVTVLDLPTLTSRLRTYFNCSTLEGAYIEQDGGTGSAGSHFERRILMNEYMTASVVKELKISEFTLALLEGSGWYTVDYTLAEPMTFGKNKGCSFLNGYCMNSATHTSNFEEYCTPLSSTQCSWNARGAGVCGIQNPTTDNNLAAVKNYWGDNTTVSDIFADNCPMIQIYSNLDCEDPANQATATLNTSERYEFGSKCFMGTIYPGGSLASPYGFCFRTVCETASGGSYRIKVLVGNTNVTCTVAGPISVPGHGGVLTCPDPGVFCNRITNEGYCRRMCSGRGACTNRACVCVDGWGHHDCSKRAYTDNSALCTVNVNATTRYGDTCVCNPNNATCQCPAGDQACIDAVNSNANSGTNSSSTSGTAGNAEGTGGTASASSIEDKIKSFSSNLGTVAGVGVGALLVIAGGIYCGIKIGASLFSSKDSAKVAPTTTMTESGSVSPMRARHMQSNHFDATLTHIDSESPSPTRSPYRKPGRVGYN